MKTPRPAPSCPARTRTLAAAGRCWPLLAARARPPTRNLDHLPTVVLGRATGKDASTATRTEAEPPAQPDQRARSTPRKCGHLSAQLSAAHGAAGWAC